MHSEATPRCCLKSDDRERMMDLVLRGEFIAVGALNRFNMYSPTYQKAVKSFRKDVEQFKLDSEQQKGCTCAGRNDGEKQDLLSLVLRADYILMKGAEIIARLP